MRHQWGLEPVVAAPFAARMRMVRNAARERFALGSHASVMLAALAGLVAAAALSGWVTGIATLTRLAPGLPMMEPTSAACMLALAATWLLPRQAATGVCVAMVLAGVGVLTEYTAGGRERLEGLLASSSATHPDGRVAVLSAAGIITLALARLTAHAHRADRPGWTERRRRLAQAAGLAVLAVCVPALLGYAFHHGDLTALGTAVPMSLPGVLALSALAAAVLLEVPSGVLPWIASGTDAGAVMVRRVLLPTFAILPGVAYLRMLGEQRGWYGSNLGAVIMTSACLFTVSAVVYVAARRTARTDRVRAEAVDTLRAITADVDTLVDVRADQLAASRHALELDRDRERIAADLHDLVIQRLFAIALSLDAGGSVGPSEQALDNAVEGIDTAIRDLRGTIFNLRSAAEEVSVIRTLTDMRLVCQAADFTADIEVEGSVDALPTPVRVHLAAVVRESVSNAVRHSGGTTVTLRIVCSNTDVTMRCADDGVGFDEETDTPSGLRNIRTRAEDLDGQATWAANVPRGTIVTWHVPLTERREVTPLRAGAQRADEISLAARQALQSSGHRPLADRLFGVAQLLRDRLGADAVVLVVGSSANPDNLVITHSDGLSQRAVGVRYHRDASLVAPALESGRCILVERLASASAVSGRLTGLSDGPGLIAPVPVPTATGAVDVAIVLLRTADAVAFTPADIDEVEAATQVAVTVLASV